MSKKSKNTDKANRRQFLGIGGAAAATVALGAIAKGQTQDPPCLTGACADAVSKMAASGRAVHVIGRVSAGKVTFDQTSLDEFAKAFPDAEMCFVAVNAPFDPVAQASV
jgi:hypothetical protein